LPTETEGTTVSTGLRDRLAQVLDRDRRVRAAAARRSVQRDQIQKLKEDITRLQDRHAAKEAQRARWMANGYHHEEEEEGNRYVNAPGATADTRAGGQRRPDAWVAGQPWYEEAQ